MRTLLSILIVLSAIAALFGQGVVDPYSTGMTLLKPEGCPVFVWGVRHGSPAERAGVQHGDHLLGVDGKAVKTLDDVARLLRQGDSAPVTLTLLRGGKKINLVSGRERESAILARNGQKIISDAIVPADTTPAEVAYMLAFDGRRIIDRVFPTHYTARPELFYAGFEIFILRDPAESVVGGIESGPASKAGVHWGDVLISVNEEALAGKTPPELEKLFSATRPVTIRLRVDRLGSIKEFRIPFQRAADIARENGRRFFNGRLVPIWAKGSELHCFLK